MGLVAVLTGWVIFIVFASERSERGNRMMLKVIILLTLNASLMLVAITALTLAMTVWSSAGCDSSALPQNEVILLTIL